MKTDGAINVIARESLDQVTMSLSRAKLPFHTWASILSCGGAITAIQKKKLPDVVDALQAAGIRHDLWAGIMNTGGAINSIAAGRLPTAIKSMNEGGIPESSIPRILRTDGMINHLYNDQMDKTGKLQTIIDVFNGKKIPVEKWEQILGAGGAFTSIAGGKSHKSMQRVLDQNEKEVMTFSHYS
jgi:hypothetical protein